MREISPRPELVEFTEWRAASQNDINYGYSLIPSGLRNAIKATLIAEQRGLCAYTGIGIDDISSHIEHLLPQQHCVDEFEDEDVAYHNMEGQAIAPGSHHGPKEALESGIRRELDRKARAFLLRAQASSAQAYPPARIDP